MKRNLIIAITVVLFSGFLVWAADKTSINGDNIALPDVATENPTAKANCLNKPDVYYGPNEGSDYVPWELRGSETPGTDVYLSTYTSTYPGVQNWKENSSSPDDPALGTRNVRMGTDGRIYIKDNSEIENGTALRAGGGSETYYVDYTDGTDDSEHGLSADTGAWKTLAYAFTRIPTDASRVTINLSSETHTPASSVTLGYLDSINLVGAWSDVSAELTADAGAQGTTSTQGSVTDTGDLSVIASSTVDETTSAAADHIHVADTSNFTVGGVIVIGFATARTEIHVIKSISAGEYLEITGKLEYEHTSGDADTVIQGAYSGKWVKFESDTTTTSLRGDYRLIDYNTADVLKISGYFDAAPQSGDTYKIVEPGATIDFGTSYYFNLSSSDNINFYYLKLLNATTASNVLTCNRSLANFYGCHISGCVTTGRQGTYAFYYSLIDASSGKTTPTLFTISTASYVSLISSIVRGPGTTGIANYGGYLSLSSGSIVDSVTSAVVTSMQGFSNFGSAYIHLRGNTTYGIRSTTGGQTYSTTNIVYLGNGTNASADATTYGYNP